MKNIGSIILVVMALVVSSYASGEVSRRRKIIDHSQCQVELLQGAFAENGDPAEEPEYSNSHEHDRRREIPGPDEVYDRDPDERSAIDPGGF